ncbi:MULTISPECIES: class II fructose-1,6-bisphosphate aldolase [Exiguobacterium]|uniref:Fructose-1,6-bisphosphate aldolase, class II n=1 Tax=Exiguobacterium sibiricum (strain DSM 17290 / CCUG 55495 / CIP 109462 / JCM 13490 / 255-15) TaxID=262543 RepID=B1YEL1_EXIS2|nr:MULTISPECIES: class II fructose-1,6-bisphosphate aldolase [Exiguobacterium]ACB62179.1 fructose-1,6-bisphosphate aldolase, class II [Exiguobacterium sibiricum 255-15]MCT4793843.1 class II fructose-1,6-bisphosphate aldolase [Exiguobacterium artemiae]MDW2885804.1 class II fructose-1,6-bisphosphate aldolase [Exiguobacterium sibiricum]MDX1259586.1 class II fructose-1,6-bisphosphate aldolase [Exiguobacterium sp. K1]RDB32241.1 class II fructose-1,6-bisphosphate aldolase [Exiguobacterium sp. RIT594
MPLVSMTDMLNKALEGKYAVGQFNINNLEWTQAVLGAAQEEQSPVILGVSEGAARHMGGFYTVVKMVEGLVHDMKVTVPVAIHLDHGSSVEKCKEAIDAGFTSVMIDDSHSPIDTNIETTKAVVEYAHSKGVSVEAEVGTVGGQEDDVIGDVMYAKLDDCVRIVKETGIDTLAPALGSVHGPYKGEPNLGFTEMEEIRNATNLPLVLHGGTGIPTHDIEKAISLGTSKINVNTENQISFAKVVREVLAEKPEAYDPRVFIAPGREAIKQTVIGKMREFGSSNKA